MDSRLAERQEVPYAAILILREAARAWHGHENERIFDPDNDPAYWPYGLEAWQAQAALAYIDSGELPELPLDSHQIQDLRETLGYFMERVGDRLLAM